MRRPGFSGSTARRGRRRRGARQRQSLRQNLQRPVGEGTHHRKLEDTCEQVNDHKPSTSSSCLISSSRDALNAVSSCLGDPRQHIQWSVPARDWPSLVPRLSRSCIAFCRERGARALEERLGLKSTVDVGQEAAPVDIETGTGGNGDATLEAVAPTLAAAPDAAP